MHAEMLKAWRKHWQTVAEIEWEEARLSSYELRWRQLNYLVGLAKALDIPLTPDDAEEEIGRARWRRLQKIYE